MAEDAGEGRALIPGIGDPQVGGDLVHEAQETVTLLREPLGADATHAGAGLAPLVAGLVGDGQQVRDHVAGVIGVHLLLKLAGDILEADELHPAAIVLQGIDHLQEVAVAGDQQDLVELAGLKHGVHRHVEIGVGLGGDVTAVIGIAAHVLNSDLPAKITHHLLIGAGLLGVFRVFAGALQVEGQIGVEALNDALIARGEAAQDVIAHLVAAVVADVLGVDEDANSHL